MSKEYHVPYVNHCFRFFLHNMELDTFRSAADKEDYLCAKTAYESLDSDSQKVLKDVFIPLGGTITDGVTRSSELNSVTEGVIWSVLGLAQKRAAAARGLS